MGKSYSYECGRCGYTAKVSGGADRGVNLHVQTISCRDCHALYDAVIRMRVPDERWSRLWPRTFNWRRQTRKESTSAPSFAAALNRLQCMGVPRYTWVRYRLQCPVSSLHRVDAWTDPGRCPKCGGEIEKAGGPFRLWD